MIDTRESALRSWWRNAVSDGEVVAAVVRGNHELFEVLVRRYNQRLFRVVRCLVRDDHEAEEALQLAYINAWRALSSFEGRARFSTWMTRIAIREARRLTRRRAMIEGVNEDLARRTGPEDQQYEAADRRADAEDARAWLERAIEDLPEPQRVVFVMRVLEEESVTDVANTLGISESNVKVRLHRARKRLSEDLVARAKGAEVWEFAGARCDRITGAVMDAVRARARESADRE